MTLTIGNTMERAHYDKVFEEEFYPHADALYNFAYNLTYSDADASDLVQETYMKAYRFVDKYHVGTNAKAWLFKILRMLLSTNIVRQVKDLLKSILKIL